MLGPETIPGPKKLGPKDILGPNKILCLKFFCVEQSETSQRLNKDLHPASQPEYEVESRLLLDVVIRHGPAIFQLLPGEDEPLLVWWISLLVLDLDLDVLN